MTKAIDNIVDYMDQGSLLGLRALGRGPVIQYTWIYEHELDLDALRRVQRNLAHTLLGRLVERSPLPFGRHRWVALQHADSIDISPTECRRNQVWDWVDQRAQVPVDPETGPPWHLGVQPLLDGGAAVSLVVSHTVADAGALILSITAAVEGDMPDLGFPPPKSRTLSRALREDIGVTMRAVAQAPAAAAGAARIAREQSDDLSESAKSSTPALTKGSRRPVIVPTVNVFVDYDEWDRVTKTLGGTSNAMLAGVAARIGKLLGRVDDKGRVMLSLPVSERTADDTRGNALSTITVMADPDRVVTDLSEVRGDLKKALTELADTRDAMFAPLPLTPYIPKVMLRRLEKLVLKVGQPIGCSNAGLMPGAVNRIDGTDAEYFAARLVEPGVTAAVFAHMGGHLLLAAGNLAGKESFTVSSWVVGGINTKEALREVVEKAMADFGMQATIE